MIEDIREKREAERINKMIAELSNSYSSDEAWSKARIITGRLVEVDKANKRLKIQHKNDGQEWITETFHAPERWDGWDWKAIRVALGEKVELTVEDENALGWKP